MTETAPEDVGTCHNGHPWTEQNTLRRVSSGKPIRQCRTCARAAAAARKERPRLGAQTAQASDEEPA